MIATTIAEELLRLLPGWKSRHHISESGELFTLYQEDSAHIPCHLEITIRCSGKYNDVQVYEQDVPGETLISNGWPKNWTIPIEDPKLFEKILELVK